MASNEHPVYKNLPLSGPGFIRLLLLQPASEHTAPLECELIKTSSRDRFEAYTALSYVWGDSIIKRTIVMNGEPHDITPNLDSALRYIRDSRRILRLWVDALCINQNDLQEKAIQVNMMGSIYAEAAHTIVYLEEYTAQSAGVLQELQNAFEYAEGSEMQIPKNMEKLRTIATEEILTRRWFRRAWVFQEIVRSRDPWLQIERDTIRWETFCSFMESDVSDHIHHNPTGHYSFSDTRRLEDSPLRVLYDMQEFRTKCIGRFDSVRSLPSLWESVTARRGCEATDPRDLVFSLIGIARERRRIRDSVLEISYEKPLAEIFTHVAAFFATDQNCEFTSLLKEAERSSTLPGLASWAVDWSRPGRKLVDLEIEWQDREDELTDVPKLLQPNVLGCSGRLAGTIDHIGTNPFTTDFFSRLSARIAEHLQVKGHVEKSFIGVAWSRGKLVVTDVPPELDAQMFKLRVEVYRTVNDACYDETGCRLISETIFTSEDTTLLLRLDFAILRRLSDHQYDPSPHTEDEKDLRDGEQLEPLRSSLLSEIKSKMEKLKQAQALLELQRHIARQRLPGSFERSNSQDFPPPGIITSTPTRLLVFGTVSLVLLILSVFLEGNFRPADSLDMSSPWIDFIFLLLAIVSHRRVLHDKGDTDLIEYWNSLPVSRPPVLQSAETKNDNSEPKQEEDQLNLFVKLFPRVFSSQRSMFDGRFLAKVTKPSHLPNWLKTHASSSSSQFALVSPNAQVGDILYDFGGPRYTAYIVRPKRDVKSQQAKYMEAKMAWLKKASEELMAKLVAEGLEGERFKAFVNTPREAFSPKSLEYRFNGHFTFVGAAYLEQFSQFSVPILQTQPAVDERPSFIKDVVKTLISNVPREHHYIALH